MKRLVQILLVISLSQLACLAQISGVDNLVMPQYPELGVRANLQGKVIISVQVNNGLITEISIDQASSAQQFLIAYTKRVLSRWVFTPGITKTFFLTFEYRLLEYESNQLDLIEQGVDKMGVFHITARKRPQTHPVQYSGTK